MIDTHAHLDDEQFAPDREAVLERSRQAGVEAVVCVGTTLDSSLAAIRLAESLPGVYAAVGIHPNSCAEAGPADWDAVAALLDHPRVVALGETGLDRYWDYAPIELQKDYLRHLRLGRERDVPVIIHCRDAQADLMPILAEAAGAGPVRGVLHAFSGDAAMAVECVRLGLYVSFAGNLTYTNKKFQPLHEAAATVEESRLLVETDCPYLTPEPLRGKQRCNEPALVAHTVARLAALRGTDAAQLACVVNANARRVFGIG